jgi:RecA/RadA recombinase
LKALKFYSSIRLQVARASTLDVIDKNGDLVQRGIRVTVKKNKVERNSLTM